MSPRLAPVLLALPLLTGCTGSSAPDAWPAGDKPRVLVTFAPLDSFARNVAGDDATVVSLLNSRGPHGFDPGVREAQTVARAQVLFANGLGLDDAIVSKLAKSRGDGLKTVYLGDALNKDTLHATGGDHDQDHDHDHAGHDHAHDHGHGAFDPHVWLGLPEAAGMVRALGKELAALDPAHAAGYESRAAAYAEKLKALHGEGKALLKEKKERSFVSFHESLRYFADSFNLKVAGVVQGSVGSDPSGPRMKRLVEFCVKEKVRLIAVEPQFPNNPAARAILDALQARGIADAAFVELDPIETAQPGELSAGLYEARVRKNLENLAKALK